MKQDKKFIYNKQFINLERSMFTGRSQMSTFPHESPYHSLNMTRSNKQLDYELEISITHRNRERII